MIGSETFFVTSASGYLAVFLIALTIGLPFYLRRRGRPLRVHYLIGYAILGIVFVHAMESMSSRVLARTNLVGLDVASVAFLLVLAQVGLGQTLAQAGSRRRVLIRLHFAVMAGIVTLLLIHIFLNSPMIRAAL